MLEMTRDGIFAWRTLTQQEPKLATVDELSGFVIQPHYGLEEAELCFMATSSQQNSPR
jgi:hypothetical protein